jgi:hypothetical protein
VQINKANKDSEKERRILMANGITLQNPKEKTKYGSYLRSIK